MKGKGMLLNRLTNDDVEMIDSSMVILRKADLLKTTAFLISIKIKATVFDRTALRSTTMSATAANWRNCEYELAKMRTKKNLGKELEVRLRPAPAT